MSPEPTPPDAVMMTDGEPQQAAPDPAAMTALRQQVERLTIQLEESESTVEAIRRGEIDALVIGNQAHDQRVYTLQSADRPYQVLVEQMQEGAITLSQEGVLLYCNRRFAAMLGIVQQRIVGQPFPRFVCPEDAPLFSRLLGQAKNASARGELLLCHGEDSRIPVHISLSLLDGEDSVSVLCGVLTDLTEQKLHLRELATANDRLRDASIEQARTEDALRQAQKMEAVGQLTGGLAHDFNNLLAGISGSLELLQRRLAEGRTHEVERYVSGAQAAAKRAAALTHRLLAFSRRQTLAPTPTNANRLIAGMADLIRNTMGPAIACQTVLADDLWSILCDPHQLENAVLNLSINARDAMPDGGRLLIETANRWLDVKAARERNLSPGDYVTVSVTDSGVGMPPEVIARAFDPFFTTKPLGQGTGLGLSMIYGFAGQSGGTARIVSAPDQGTCVRLYLPRHAVAEIGVRDEEPPRLLTEGDAGETVLVIDDEETLRELVTEVLRDAGYSTIEAGDGPGGLRILQSAARIDLLITDVGLPGGMNGRQVADAARLHRPGLKVLFITGFADTAAVRDGHMEPGMEVMTKPFAMSAFSARVRAMIED